MSENLPQYVRVSQLCGIGPYKGQRPIFAVTKQAISLWIKRGVLPEPIRTGRHIMWKAEDIRAAIKRIEEEEASA
jgi:hypothetical protein